MNKKKGLQLFVNFISILLLIGLDQGSKYLAVLQLKGKTDFILWKDVFVLHYLENRGAAFGMLKNQKLFFVFVAVVILTLIIYVLVKIPQNKKYRVMQCFLVMIAAGAVGNMIDRLLHDYVVDFFYFVLINFPVFNVADIYVTVGTIVLALCILFFYQEEELKFLKPKIEKNNLRF